MGRPKTTEKSIVKPGSGVQKIKDLPAYLAYLQRQKALGRKRIECDGQWMTPQAAIDHVYSLFPWL